MMKVCLDLSPVPVSQRDGSQGGVRVCGIQVCLPFLPFYGKCEYILIHQGVVTATIGTQPENKGLLLQGDHYLLFYLRILHVLHSIFLPCVFSCC